MTWVVTDVDRSIRFAPYSLDLRTQRLWRGDEAVDLRPKAWELLRYLAERPDRLITKDELMDAVWSDVSVTIANINQTVLELRQALGDDARNPRFIETVPRRGFRFVAPVTRSDADAQSPRTCRARRSIFGRDEVLASLEGFLSKAKSGRRQVVFVTGEPGIGKTSLLDTFLEGLGKERVAGNLFVGGAQCIELLGESEAYLPVLDALDRIARGHRGEPLREALRKFAPTWLAQLPWLVEGDIETRPPSAGTPTRMLREFCVVLEALASQRPTVLWLEDLHWSDAATIDLLGALARRPEPARLLVIATYRPVDAAMHRHPIAELKRELRQSGSCGEIPLELLDSESVGACLRVRFGDLDQSDELTRLVHARTDGNPLFVQTVADHMVAKQWVVPGDQGWELATTLDSIQDHLPESLQEIVAGQLARLAAEETSALEAASVAGESFPAQAIAAALEIEIDRAEAVCSRLADWGRMISAAGTARWPDRTEAQSYEFVHQIFRKVLYDRIPPALRQRLHLRLARGLERAHADHEGGGAAEIALHFELGADPDHAIHYLCLAAEGVQRRFADREAVTYLGRALGLLAGLPESAERDRREVAVRLQLARALIYSVGYTAPEQVANTDRVIELGECLNDAQARLNGRGFRQDMYILAGDLDRGRDEAEGSLLLARDGNHPIFEGHAYSNLAFEASLRGDHARVAEACACSRSLLLDIEPREISRFTDFDSAVQSLAFSSWAEWMQGRPDAARRFSAATRERWEREGTTPLGTLGGLSLCLSVEHFRRDREAARVLRRELEDCLEEYGLHWAYALPMSADGWLRVADGEVDAAIELLESGLAEIRSSGAAQATSILCATLAEAELARGRADAALEALDEAIQYVEKADERFWEAEIHRLRGESLRLSGDDTTAEESFAKSLEVSRSQGARSLALRGATSLARLWMETGRSEDARPVLSDALEGLTGGSDTADYQDAAALLATWSK